jgi:hypothetical protein
MQIIRRIGLSLLAVLVGISWGLWCEALEINVSLDNTTFSNSSSIKYVSAEGKQKVELVNGSLVDVNPAMTSDTTPSPYVTSASTYLDDLRRPWHAFHDAYVLDAYPWHTAQFTLTGWIKIDRGVGNETIVNYYKMAPHWDVATGAARAPKNWTFEGSNNNVDWITLDTQTNVSNWTVGVYKAYAFSNSTAYRYYRINITANNGDTNFLSIGQIEMMFPYPSDGPTATLLQVDLGSSQTMIANQFFLFPSQTVSSVTSIQARYRTCNTACDLNAVSWSSWLNATGLNGTTPDTANRLYYFLNTSSITFWKGQADFKLNSNGIDRQEIGRPIIGNFIGGGSVIANASDIRNGVTISTTLGNIVLPIPRNVKSGIGYGAGGIENSGTYKVPLMGGF